MGGGAENHTGAGSAAGVGFATAVFVGTGCEAEAQVDEAVDDELGGRPRRPRDGCGGSASKTTSRGPLHRCVWFTSRYRWSTWSCVRIVVHSPAPLANSPCIDSVIARAARVDEDPCCAVRQNLFLVALQE